jgi:hypothetical protein
MDEAASPCTQEIIRRVNVFVDGYDGPRYEALSSLGISPNHLHNWNRRVQNPSGPIIDRLMDRLGLVIVEAPP